MIGGFTGFNVLQSFTFNCDVVSCLTFEAGAMLDLKELQLVIDIDEWDKATPVGLQHLPSLERIIVELADPAATHTRTDEECWTKEDALIRTVFQEAADSLPTRPAVPPLEGRFIRATLYGS